ncbi:Ku protein [Streptomyces sp. H34-S4]|uniref:non-homologous end joining protein Ku n=1 Tax=Streptomyces sp. H34-S4 TaxID=2996463 RepID=UPI002270552E|nr:Ku protein [Streptomyces sp. H34-S4]MCY0933391.1 Ku protein [Streptomyces sp. H34-S4]
MRSIWNGAISFGLVSIPIKLVNATESHSISFRQIHVSDGGRVRYRKVCELDGEEVSTAEIGKGYEEADGSIIPITDEDLAQLPIATAKTIEIVSFVPADQIDPLQMDAAYYLAASGATAAKPYTLLREALNRSRKVAIAKYALRGRERLGMLRVVGDVIAMHGLLWPDEIRVPEGVAPEGEVSVREAELDLADALMATLGEVEMDSLRDDYREAVEAMVAAKAGGGEGEAVAVAGPEAAGGQVIDLMAALENSVRAAKESRAGRGGAESEGEGASGGGAEVTPIRRRGGGAAPKAVGGKKSTASVAGGRGAGSSAGGGGGGSAGAGAGKKSTAAAAAKKKAATGAAAAKKTASAKSAEAKPARAAAKKAAATPRKRSSA